MCSSIKKSCFYENRVPRSFLSGYLKLHYRRLFCIDYHYYYYHWCFWPLRGRIIPQKAVKHTPLPYHGLERCQQTFACFHIQQTQSDISIHLKSCFRPLDKCKSNTEDLFCSVLFTIHSCGKYLSL